MGPALTTVKMDITLIWITILVVHASRIVFLVLLQNTAISAPVDTILTHP